MHGATQGQGITRPLSVYVKTITIYFAICEWCDLQVDITDNKPGRDPDVEFQRELPEGWERDWESVENKNGYAGRYPPIYCSETHKDRARQVAALKALP